MFLVNDDRGDEKAESDEEEYEKDGSLYVTESTLACIVEALGSTNASWLLFHGIMLEFDDSISLILQFLHVSQVIVSGAIPSSRVVLLGFILQVFLDFLLFLESVHEFIGGPGVADCRLPLADHLGAILLAKRLPVTDLILVEVDIFDFLFVHHVSLVVNFLKGFLFICKIDRELHVLLLFLVAEL